MFDQLRARRGFALALLLLLSACAGAAQAPTASFVPASPVPTAARLSPTTPSVTAALQPSPIPSPQPTAGLPTTAPSPAPPTAAPAPSPSPPAPTFDVQSRASCIPSGAL